MQKFFGLALCAAGFLAAVVVAGTWDANDAAGNFNELPWAYWAIAFALAALAIGIMLIASSVPTANEVWWPDKIKPLNRTGGQLVPGTGRDD